MKRSQALCDERPVHAKAPGHGREVRQVNSSNFAILGLLAQRDLYSVQEFL